MNALIETIYPTGSSLYAIIHNPNGQVWNKTLNTGAGGWENYNSGHWSQYAIAMTEQSGSGYYSVAYPSGISGVLTTEVIYANGTPTLGDAPVGIAESQGTNIAAIGGDATAAPKLQRSASSIVTGKVIAGTLTTVAFTTDIINANVNAFQGRSVLFASGTLAGQGGVVSEFDPSTGLVTVTGAFTGAPAIDDEFSIS